MAFIDEVVIQVAAGNGGNGCVSFRREKYVPRGGPDGGNGGRGGHVYLVPTRDKLSLLDFKFRPKFQGGRGQHGMGSDMFGVKGDDLFIPVPVGTLVYDSESNFLLTDLTQEEVPFLIAEGGRGGRGNLSFVSSTNRAPRTATPGEEGQIKQLRLELRLLADVGLVGLPNAGKSTFLSVVSNARPKIANYPFTTLEPNLGVVDYHGVAFVVADLPGLIEGASEGVGLGFKFLKHVSRTQMILHLVDFQESPDEILKNIQMIRKEIISFDPDLKDKEEWIVFTKADTLSAEEKVKKLEELKFLGINGFLISSQSKEGMKTLLDPLADHVRAKKNILSGPVNLEVVASDPTPVDLEAGEFH